MKKNNNIDPNDHNIISSVTCTVYFLNVNTTHYSARKKKTQYLQKLQLIWLKKKLLQKQNYLYFQLDYFFLLFPPPFLILIFIKKVVELFFEKKPKSAHYNILDYYIIALYIFWLHLRQHSCFLLLPLPPPPPPLGGHHHHHQFLFPFFHPFYR